MARPKSFEKSFCPRAFEPSLAQSFSMSFASALTIIIVCAFKDNSCNYLQKQPLVG
jgi:hypothetical protein